MDFREIEKKWQKKWADAGIFEPKISKKKKYFVTFPYPYVNGSPHVGHSFTAFRVDSYARFKRMQGYNVLYPQGFHATGEPILGVVERLRQGDPVQIETLRLGGASEADIAKFREEGPENVARFWTARWKEELKLAGFSIDWSRSFITAITPTYNRFIEWQYNTLRKLGYVAQGTHPVIWCPHCKSPTGDHDRLEGEGESPIEYTILKFRLSDEISAAHRSPVFLVAATLRPETIYGITNMWLNPDAEYVIASVRKDGNEELWLISREAAAKLSDQLYEVRELEHIPANKLVGKRVIEPVGGKAIPILPAHFVDTESATGVVMSVPAHAPYDWAGVYDFLKEPEQMERYGVKEAELKPITMANTPGLQDPPAVKIFESMGIKSQKDGRLLDEATSVIYKKEFHQGILSPITGKYAGKKISEIKDEIVGDFTRKGFAASMWETTATVVCRCKTLNHIKILENQWFLRFSDPEWKSKVRSCLEGMNVYPDAARQNFIATIDWLKDKACARRSGLGTPLPWDPSWIVETLSDSTIYMAYYTISGIINREKLKPENLPDELFDYIFIGKGNLKDISKSSGLSSKIIEEMKQQFDYWYPVDMRNSGKDLIQHHLTFYLFHHTAIFGKDKWPKGIAVNGYVNVEGEKMSKSKGNIIPFRNIIEKHGSDLVRINITCDAENLEDANWREININSYRTRLELISKLVSEAKRSGKKRGKEKLSHLDSWLLGEIQKAIKDATAAYEELKFRTAVQSALFATTNSLKWYFRRTDYAKGANPDVLRWCAEDIVRLMTPLIPHLAEEWWEHLGNRTFVADAEWPIFQEEFVSKHAEEMESFVRKIIEDAEHISTKIVKRAPKKVSVFMAKTERFANPEHKKEQMKILMDAIPFFEREMACKFEIIDSDISDNPKAQKAMPEKPGILIE